MLASILAAISESLATIIDKLTLNINKISGKTYTAWLFLFMALISIPLVFYYKVEPGAFAITPLIILSLIIIGSAIQNILFYIGLKSKELSAIEPIRNSEPILIILLAFLVFPSERSWPVLILAIITTIAIIYSHLEKSETKRIKIAFDKYAYIVLLSMLISAGLNIGYKYLLDFHSPLTLYIFRSIGVATILLAYYRPHSQSTNSKQLGLIFISAFFYSAAAILKYFAISEVGLSTTILILTLAPALIYILSKTVLKEELTKNRIISSIIIIICVAAAYIYL